LDNVSDDAATPPPHGPLQPPLPANVAAAAIPISQIGRTRYHRQMRWWLQALVVLWLAPIAFAKAPPPPASPASSAPPPVSKPTKLITVVAADWASTTGELRRWERAGRKWLPVGAPVPVVLGRAGLAWPADKHEGDGRSPAGRLGLGDATGYDEAPRGMHLLYWHADDESLRCVDDPKSPMYNELIDTSLLSHEPPWSSDEPMHRDDELYRYTIFVRHNPTRTPGAGSCIFLHVWRDETSPTLGCTAMPLVAMSELITWVTNQTELVQLPREEYAKRQRAWGLPALQRK